MNESLPMTTVWSARLLRSARKDGWGKRRPFQENYERAERFGAPGCLDTNTLTG
ncbi:hypothetical protein ACFL1X_07005 [Candidatus Hydrogenedentota bacterium]